MLHWMVYVSSEVCGLEEKDGLGKVGDFVVWRKVTGLGKCHIMITGFEINKPTSGSVVELLVCRVSVIGFVFSSHLPYTKWKPSEAAATMILQQLAH